MLGFTITREGRRAAPGGRGRAALLGPWGTGRLALGCSLLALVLPFNLDVDRPYLVLGPRGSYFGYSVGLLRNAQGTWVLVGAPLANDSEQIWVKKPGGLFQCSLESQCRQVAVDNLGNVKHHLTRWKNITLHHSKDYQWLGATLDVNVFGNMSVLVCAPRWKDREFYVQGHEFMNGLCYSSASDLYFDNSSAWPVLEYYRKQIHLNGHYVYGKGSLGLSAQFSKDGKHAILGAPGINDWTGGFAKVSRQIDAWPLIHEPVREYYNGSYIGYSVTTGHLSADSVAVIVGAPRAAYTGKVFIYSENTLRDGYDLMLEKQSDQFGSYYGAAVATADLTGDGLDEVIVGAPHYSQARDEGRVFIFINKEFYYLEPMAKPLEGSNLPGAKFGMALANLGDINKDGCQDLAVGAPFEADMGAVYIYNGARDGLQPGVAQKITGKDFRPQMTTFGWSFSRPLDVDGNNYPDIAVGSFASDQVMVLRTRPVINLRARLDISPSILYPDGQPRCLYRGAPSMCILAVACFEYKGDNIAETAELDFRLSLDTLERHRGERKRLFMVDPATDQEVTEEKGRLKLTVGKWNCEKSFTVYAKKSRDLITPLRMELEYTIPLDSHAMYAGCDICPILNIYRPTKIVQEAMFTRDCGYDNECESDLHLEARVQHRGGGAALLLDDAPSFQLELLLENRGETAYMASVSLAFPPALQFTRAETILGSSQVSCVSTTTDVHNDTSTLLCDVDSPVRNRQRLVFLLKFYATSWPFDQAGFNVTLETSSATKERNTTMGDNFAVVSIPVRLKSDVLLTGASLPGKLEIPRKLPQARSEQEEWQDVQHIFEVRNLGPSPLPHAALILLVPVSRWLRVGNIEKMPDTAWGRSNVLCQLHQPTATAQRYLTSSSPHRNTTLESVVSTVDMSCATHLCINVTCFIRILHKVDSLFVKVNMAVKRSVLDELQIKKELRIISTAKIVEPNFDTFIRGKWSTNTSAVTFLTRQVVAEAKVQVWVLAVSVVSGLLLLYLLGMILWKCGFFKRKKREELQRLLMHAELEREANQVSRRGVDVIDDIMVLPPSTDFLPEESQWNNNHNHWLRPPAFNNDTYLEPISMPS